MLGQASHIYRFLCPPFRYLRMVSKHIPCLCFRLERHVIELVLPREPTARLGFPLVLLPLLMLPLPVYCLAPFSLFQYYERVQFLCLAPPFPLELVLAVAFPLWLVEPVDCPDSEDSGHL